MTPYRLQLEAADSARRTHAGLALNGAGSWSWLRADVEEFCHWAAVRAANQLLRRPLSFPEPRGSEDPVLAAAVAGAEPLLAAHASAAVASERRYWADFGAAFEPGEASERQAVRIRVVLRNANAAAFAAGQSGALRLPGVADRWPTALYLSRHLPRTRPTHSVMSGFSAPSLWKGWDRIRPPNGFNCVCFLRYIHRSDAAPPRGPKWPNSASRRNYEGGLFPDPGFTNEVPLDAE